MALIRLLLNTVHLNEVQPLLLTVEREPVTVDGAVEQVLSENTAHGPLD